MKQPKPQPAFKNAIDPLTASMLSKLIIAIAVILLFLVVSGLFDSDWKMVVTAAVGLVLLVMPFWLVRRGRVFAGSIFLMVFMFALVTVFATIGQGIRDIALVAFPVIYIFAGLTFNRTILRICIASSIVSAAWLAFGEKYGWFVPNTQTGIRGWPEFLMATAILLVAAMAVSLLLQNMRRNLEQLRTAQGVLKSNLEVAQGNLQETLSRYNALIDSSHSIILEWDTGGNILFMNKWGLELFGFTAEELVGRNVVGTIVPAVDTSGKNLVEKMEVVQKTPDEFYSSENENIKKNGERVWINWTNKGISDQNGKLVKTLSVGIDRTLQHQQELELARYSTELETQVSARTRELQEAVNSLRASDERFQLSMEATNDGLWDWDIRSDTGYFSPGYYRLLGYEDRAFPYDMKEWKDRIHPADYEKALRDNTDCIEGRVEQFETEFRMRTRNGEWLWILGRGKCVARDKRGRAIRMVGTHVDISQRKKSEEVLLKSEKLYKDTFDNAPIGIFRTTEEGKFILTNNKLARMLGYATPEELISTVNQTGIAQALYANPPGRERIIDDAKAKPESEWIIYENEYRRKDGSTFTGRLNVRLVRKADDTVDYIDGMVEDITERKKAEYSLVQSEEKIRRIFFAIAEGIMITDMKGNIVDCNENLVKLFKANSKDELIGVNTLELVTRESTEKVLTQRKIHRDANIEYSAIRRDGSTFNAEVSGSILSDNNGTPVMRVSSVRDITERKQAEEENRKLREKAEMSSRLAAVGEMAAGIAHEINNPLTGVIGFSELLLERPDLPEDVRDQLKVIADGSDRVKDVVRRLLTFARQNKTARTMASLNELIENTLNLRTYVLRTANIEVIKHLDPGLPWIMVDPGQMQQVFLNLIVNAEYCMKKAHGKGTLTITTTRTDSHIRISFQDDGTGMSPEIKAKVFNPFFTTKDVGEGTGLGLSLSHSIILDHSGTIEVESELEKGATFIITLPLSLASEEAALKTPAVSGSSSGITRSARVLVVDDEEGVRKLAITILAYSGHIVDATGDAREGLTKLQNNSYDMVLMDIRMPGMSGMELYEKSVQQHPELSGRFLFITGDTSDAQTRSFLESNHLPCITKPFDRDTLMKKVEGLLE